MKLTYEDKIDIYRLRKEEHLNIRMIADRYKIGIKNIKYLVDLINLYGIAIAKKKNNRKYSIEFKEVAINRVLLGHESQEKVSLSLALPGRGTLSIWIKLYIKNGYNGYESWNTSYNSGNTTTKNCTSETSTHTTFDCNRSDTSFSQQPTCGCSNKRAADCCHNCTAYGLSEVQIVNTVLYNACQPCPLNR